MDKSTQSPEFSLQALRSGDRVEFARLVEAYSGYIYRVALKLTKDPQDAEDVLQETFLKAYRSMSKFRGRSKITTWLYRIATNEALMLLRRRSDALSVESPYPDGGEGGEPLQIVDWCCLPEPELMSEEALSYLDGAIEKLSDALRVVFVLRDIEGLSTRDTAEILELSESAVKTRLFRARMHLRELLSEYYGQKLTPEMISTE